jgi:hypothetical protein
MTPSVRTSLLRRQVIEPLEKRSKNRGENGLRVIDVWATDQRFARWWVLRALRWFLNWLKRSTLVDLGLDRDCIKTHLLRAWSCSRCFLWLTCLSAKNKYVGIVVKWPSDHPDFWFSMEQGITLCITEPLDSRVPRHLVLLAGEEVKCCNRQSLQ